MDQIHSVSDFSPVYISTLMAGIMAASNAVLVVLKSSNTTKAQIIGFSTGMLFSGLLMAFW